MYVKLLRDMESIRRVYEEMQEEVSRKRESILARLERGGSIEDGGKIAG